MADIEALQASLRSLWDTKEYADLIVNCGSQTFQVHRALVAPRSSFFHKALSGGKKGARFIEGQSGTITLKEDDPEMVQRMFQFLYLLEYSAPQATVQESEDDSQRSNAEPYNNGYEATTKATTASDLFSALKIHASMFALAEKYQVDSLKSYAADRFRTDLACSRLAGDAFIATVELVYASTPDSVRDLKNVLVNGQTATAVESKLREYRAHVKNWEAYSDFVGDVLHKAKEEKDELQEEIHKSYTRIYSGRGGSLRGRGRGMR